jgi:hypothetical protein
VLLPPHLRAITENPRPDVSVPASVQATIDMIRTDAITNNRFEGKPSSKVTTGLV